MHEVEHESQHPFQRPRQFVPPIVGAEAGEGINHKRQASKVRAAKMVGSHGIDTIVANGRYQLAQVLDKKVPRTLFRAG